jgi:hypothetical protein
MQSMNHVSVKRVRATIIAVEKQSLLDILSGRARARMCVALDIHHEMRMRAILSSVTYAALQQFSTLFHKRHDFRKKKC